MRKNFLTCLALVTAGVMLPASQPSAAENPPRNLAVAPGGLGDDFVALFWDKPDPNVNPTVTGYSVRRNGTEVLTTTKLHAFVTGLTPATTYTFTVRANGSGGQSADGSALTVTTRPAAQIFDVTAYGAKGDGTTDDWAAIKAAIDACPSGGKVYFPGNKTYSTGTLRFMKSNVLVQLGDSAVIQVNPSKRKPAYNDTSYFKQRYCGSTDANLMPTLLFVGYLPDRENPDFKTESQKRVVTDVCIYGHGKIFGSSVKDGVHDTRIALSATQRARRVLWYGLTLYGGEGWLNTIDYSDNVTIMDCRVGALDPKKDLHPWSGRDGWNPVFSSCIYFMGCDFATGDDCIALKTEKRTGDPQYNDKLRYVEGTGSTHHIRITNCGLYRSVSASGITFGSEITFGISDVFVQDCEGGAGILYKGSPDRGGYIRNIVVKDTRMPLSGFNYYYNWALEGPAPNDIRDCLFENCDFVMIEGGTSPNQPLRNFTFINCTASYNYDVTGPCENWAFYGCDVRMSDSAPAGSVVTATVPDGYQRLTIDFPCSGTTAVHDAQSAPRTVPSRSMMQAARGGVIVVDKRLSDAGPVLLVATDGRVLARSTLAPGASRISAPAGGNAFVVFPACREGRRTVVRLVTIGR